MKKNDPCESLALEKMATLELKSVLNEELEKEQLDDEKIHAILCVLKSRETTPPEVTPEAAAAWEKFQRKQESRGENTSAPRKGRGKRWRIAAAAVAVLVILITVVPPVMGADDFFVLIGRWTEDVFQLFDPNEPTTSLEREYVFETENPGLQQLYDAVTQMGATEPIVPMWLPEGCVLDELNINTAGTAVFAIFEDSENYVSITIEKILDAQPHFFSKDDTDIIELECSGMIYYIIPNENIFSAIWTVGQYECSAVTTYGYNDLCKIITSIFGGK